MHVPDIYLTVSPLSQNQGFSEQVKDGLRGSIARIPGSEPYVRDPVALEDSSSQKQGNRDM